MIFTIAQHEWVRLFKSGKIWKLLALCQFILGLIFYWLMEEFSLKTRNAFLENNYFMNITEEVVHPLLAWAALLSFFITPMLTIHSITQERKARVFNLYFISAVSTKDIILGKFLGLLLAKILLLLPVFLMPLSIIMLQSHLDVAQWLSGIIGLIFLLGATLSLGMWVSSMAKEPLVAGLVVLVLFFLLTLLEWIAPFFNEHFKWLVEFSLLYHCKNFFSGVIDSRDIIYYSIFCLLFLSLSKICLDKETYFNKLHV